MWYDLSFFFFNDTATTEIYTLSLHDALPISPSKERPPGLLRSISTRPRRRGLPRTSARGVSKKFPDLAHSGDTPRGSARSEEHTSELQSRQYLVCRLLLEKKKLRIDRVTIAC